MYFIFPILAAVMLSIRDMYTKQFKKDYHSLQTAFMTCFVVTIFFGLLSIYKFYDFNTTIIEAKKLNESLEFVENEYFFSTDIDLRSRFLSESPYSKFNLDIDKQSPGAIGRWLGYKIVYSYMTNNNINLNELGGLDHYTIFKSSKYKPFK